VSKNHRRPIYLFIYVKFVDNFYDVMSWYTGAFVSSVDINRIINAS